MNNADTVQIDYNEAEGTLTLNLPKDILEHIGKVVVTVYKSIEVGTIELSKERMCNG